MQLNTLVEILKIRLTQPLPGRAAQLALISPQALLEYEKRFEQETAIKNARQSSVLILLYEKNGQLFIPLIKRPEYEGVHSGQIALPGGKVEPDDKDLQATALRETYEEIGIPSEKIQVLGMLTPVFIPPSRFWVNVVVGYCNESPAFIPDAREVETILELPIKHLQDANHIEERSVMTSNDWKMKATGYVFQNHFIWGATSMILTELRALLKVETENHSGL
jgi:8-oxo-dGTP pyrophosphatase MutT (NUDIX family)